MFTVLTTTSGARYHVRVVDGVTYVTRLSAGAEIVNRDGSIYTGFVSSAEVLSASTAAVGESWFFRTEAGRFTTTPLVSMRTDFYAVCAD